MEGGFGDFKQDYRLGQVFQILANVNRNAKKQRTPYKTEDFTMRPKRKTAMTQDKQKYIRQRLDAMAKKGK